MQFEVGSIVEGKVTGITKFGAFVDIGGGKTGMVHISEVAPTYVKEISDHLTDGQVVKVKILNILDDGKISLSIKKAMAPPPERQGNRQSQTQPQYNQKPHFANRGPKNDPRRVDPSNMSFEDMLNKFKQSSDDRMSDLKKNNEGRRSRGSKRGPKG